jgi:hypothetical protein
MGAEARDGELRAGREFAFWVANRDGSICCQCVSSARNDYVEAPPKACPEVNASGSSGIPGRERLLLKRLLPARIKRSARRGALTACGLAIALSCGPAFAMTDCPVNLISAYVGDVHGDGTYALWVAYTYTASTGTPYTGQGYILLSSPAASYVSAVVIEARATGQTALTIRYDNSSGESQDSVCEASPTRSDLIGVWLPSGG